MAIFYHGTATPFIETIREHGLVPPAGHGRGVRLSRDGQTAKRHARAWAAYVLYQQMQVPEGMIAVCKIDDLSRLRVDSNDVIRAKFVLPVEITAFRGPLSFPEFGDPELDPDGPRPEFFEALEEWEDLTAQRVNVPFPRRRARRN